MRHRIVHTVEHDVFESHEVARRFLDVPHTRGQKLTYRVLSIDRHELVA